MCKFCEIDDIANEARRLTLPPARIYRWLNFFWRLKDKEVQSNDRKCNDKFRTL